MATTRRRNVRGRGNENGHGNGFAVTSTQWVWAWRVGQLIALLLGLTWAVFQFYAGVERLKEEDKALRDESKATQSDVKSLFRGQDEIQKSQNALHTTLTRIETALVTGASYTPASVPRQPPPESSDRRGRGD